MRNDRRARRRGAVALEQMNGVANMSLGAPWIAADIHRQDQKALVLTHERAPLGP